MSTSLSLYLDGVRFCAALAVLVAHLGARPITGKTFLWRFDNHGDVAVMAFFVLSGYVIAHVVATRERTLWLYAVSRISRLYSVVLVALTLTALLDAWGAHLAPGFYLHPKVFMMPPRVRDYVATLFFVNEYQIFAFGGIAPGSNAPFWSLSFEATYYLVAGAVLFLRWFVWVPFGVALLWCAGPTIAVLLPLWAAGYALYHAPALRLSAVISACLLALSTAGLGALPWLGEALDWAPLWDFPYGRGPFPRNIALDYLTGALVILHLAAVRCCLQGRHRVPSGLACGLRWLGGLTFPLYCVHYPVLCFLAAISPWPDASGPHLLYLIAGVFAATVICTVASDVLKRWGRMALLTFGPRSPPAAR